MNFQVPKLPIDVIEEVASLQAPFSGEELLEAVLAEWRRVIATRIAQIREDGGGVASPHTARGAGGFGSTGT